MFKFCNILDFYIYIRYTIDKNFVSGKSSSFLVEFVE